MKAWIEEIERINKWLQEKFWSRDGLRWIVGEEKGLDCRKGALWYGGGETVYLGQGF